MVRASGQIEQSLTQLQTATEEMQNECEELYQNYFEALSKAGQRQLALAAYHLCTHVYPDQFLALKFSQREKLQRAIRRLGRQIYEQLMAEWVKAKELSRREDLDDPMATIKQLFLQAESRETSGDDDEARKLEAELALRALDSQSFDEDAFDDVEFDDDVLDEQALDDLTARSQAVEALASELLLAEATPDDFASDQASSDEVSLDATFPDGGAPETQPPETQPPETERPDTPPGDSPSILFTRVSSGAAAVDGPDAAATPITDAPLAELRDLPVDESPLDPVQLLKQQIFVEKAIRNVLKAVSETANHMLQQAKIVPEMPKQLLTAVSESDGVAQSPLKMPHLLKVSVKVLNVDDGSHDKGRHKKRRKPRLVELEAFPEFVIIYLRLTEIEFAEPSVSIWRGRIREQLTKLKKLGRTYQKNQRELAIAQAEDAWRASWIED
ncbi:MAG: hypothetical protein AAF921_16455 [Cyanobacteria bacterium P01_D01_bin.44]